jgi:hypothetical protein
VTAFDAGATAEEISQQYSSIDLACAYPVSSYVLDPRREVDEYVARRPETGLASMMSTPTARFTGPSWHHRQRQGRSTPRRPRRERRLHARRPLVSEAPERVGRGPGSERDHTLWIAKSWV